MHMSLCRKIAQVIDQIRLFRESRYSLVCDKELQLNLQQRMKDMGQQDLHALASQQDNNYTKFTHSRFPAVFRRIKKNKQDL